MLYLFLVFSTRIKVSFIWEGPINQELLFPTREAHFPELAKQRSSREEEHEGETV